MGWSRICIGAVPYHPSDVCAWTIPIPCHICAATALSPYHIRTIRNAKARACEPPPHLPRDWAHPAAPWHICTKAGPALAIPALRINVPCHQGLCSLRGTSAPGLGPHLPAPSTSAPGLGPILPHLWQYWHWFD